MKKKTTIFIITALLIISASCGIYINLFNKYIAPKNKTNAMLEAIVETLSNNSSTSNVKVLSLDSSGEIKDLQITEGEGENVFYNSIMFERDRITIISDKRAYKVYDAKAGLFDKGWLDHAGDWRVYVEKILEELNSKALDLEKSGN